MAIKGDGGGSPPKPYRPPPRPRLPYPTRAPEEKPKPKPPDEIYERRTPTFPPPSQRKPAQPEPAAAPKPAGGGGFCGSEEWVKAFVAAHGRAPTQKDLKDCQWSQDFLRKHGRPPTEDEWKQHWYGEAGGGGGGGGEEEPEEIWPKAGELLEKLAFPTAEALPPFLREWARYFQDLLAQNPEHVVPLPFRPTEEGEAEDTAWRETLTQLAQQLGLGELLTKEPEDPIAAYQQFIDALTNAPLPAQQLLIGLRYTPEGGWHRVQTPMLPHPQYL